MDGGAWWAAVPEVAKSQTQRSDFTFTFHFHALEKEMQPTPVFLPGESQGRGSLVGCHLWGHTESDSDLAAAAAGLVAQLCLTLRPHGLWPTRLLFPWRILQARILE